MSQDQWGAALRAAVLLELEKRDLALRAEYREVLTLYYFQDMTVTQIAEILEESVNTVKSRLLRGREKLKNMLA